MCMCVWILSRTHVSTREYTNKSCVQYSAHICSRFDLGVASRCCFQYAIKCVFEQENSKLNKCAREGLYTMLGATHAHVRGNAWRSWRTHAEPKEIITPAKHRAHINRY